MDLLSKINELSEILNGYEDHLLKNEIATLKEKVIEKKLYVVVVGLFKRGKSTLINSLIDKNILPSSVTPVTALITIIEYNENRGATVFFMDSKATNIGINEVDEYVTEEKNPENKKKVYYVRIFDNAEILKSASLVDTPGLGSAYEHNTKATLAFIPKIDAALFLLSADIPVSAIDLELLKELKGHVAKIIFVLNKADLLQNEDLQKIIQHNKKVLSKALQQDEKEIQFRIVSNKDSEKKNLTELKNELQNLGKDEKEELIQTSSQHQLKLLWQQVALHLKFIRDSYLLPLHELENRTAQLTSSIQLMNEQKDEFESIINGKIKQLKQNINDDVNEKSNELKVAINQLINNIIDIKSPSLKGLQRKLDDLILSTFEKLKDEWELKAKEHFKNLLEQYSQRSQSFLHELSENLSAHLGQNMNLISSQFDLNVYTSFYLSLSSGSSGIDNPVSFYDKIFPSSFQRKKIKAKYHGHYKEIIIRNTASVMYDLSYKIQESFRKFNYDLDHKMNEVLTNMEKNIKEVIENKTKTEVRSEEKITDLNDRLISLKDFD